MAFFGREKYCLVFSSWPMPSQLVFSLAGIVLKDYSCRLPAIASSPLIHSISSIAAALPANPLAAALQNDTPHLFRR